MNYNNVALAVIPSGIKSSIVYSLIGGNMTFARGSSATRRNKDGLIEYVDTGVPRIDYEGAIPHLLLEPQRTNDLQYSEDFSNAYWTKLNSTITSNANIAPDGNSTADAFYEDSATGEHQVRRTAFSFNSSNPYYTFSVFAKYNGRNKFNIYSNNQNPWAVNVTFDLQLGVVSSENSGTGKIEDYGNGWYRCSATGACSVTGSSNVTMRFRNDANQTNYAGDTNLGAYIWGAQIEVGSYATSYIPNLATGSTTRNAETCLDATGSFNSSEGVLFAELAPLADDGTFRLLSISDGTSSNRVSIYYSSISNTISENVYVGGILQSSISYDLGVNYFNFVKIACKYKQDDFSLWINGVEVGTDPTGNVFASGTLNSFDFSSGISSYFYGKVRQAVVFDSALTDAQLIELTR